MREEAKNRISETIDYIDLKIGNKEDNVRGSIYMLGVGLAGTIYGALAHSDSSLISGMIVSSGSLIFRAINQMLLNKLRVEKFVFEYALRHDGIVEYNDDEYDGKHFKNV